MKDPNIIILNKPFKVLSQFTDKNNRKTLLNFINSKGFYPIGRLDYDSEGMLLLTNDGMIQSMLSAPQNKVNKHYWVQVEGVIDSESCCRLTKGIELNDGFASAVECNKIAHPAVWERFPPIRNRKTIPTSWMEIVLDEGRNRQVRRMTAAIGFPTLRLIRHRIGQFSLAKLAPGESKKLKRNLNKLLK